MGKSHHDIEVLCKKYLERTISEEEVGMMLDYFKANGIPDSFDEALRQEFSSITADNSSTALNELTSSVKVHLTNHIAPKNRFARYRWLPYVAAVVVFSIVALSWYIFIPGVDDNRIADMEIVPGGNRATITLADGRVVSLNENHDGIIMDGQEIRYSQGTSHILDLATTATQRITLRTPRGGMYNVTLADGTMVWLNAESTLKYPSRFDQEERVVELEGEAYFDVKQRTTENADGHFQPFKVISANQTITVLGTEFNVSAYTDENDTKTTLVAGKVRVQSAQDHKKIMLLPGEQGIIGQDGIAKNKVDVGDYIDWMNGEFVFRNETAKEVLHRIARWYDIDIEYGSYVPSGEVFSGSISRYSNLQTVLDIMQEAGDLRFDIKNRTVIVRHKFKS